MGRAIVIMGGGLNFLNKKTWHPARPQNLEEVWKREQAAAAEAKKAEELRKQLEEERKRSEFVQMAMDTGHLRWDRQPPSGFGALGLRGLGEMIAAFTPATQPANLRVLTTAFTALRPQ